METIVLKIILALKNMGWQLIFLLGPIFLSCVVLHFLDKLLNRNMQRLIGRARIYLTGWIGTPIHELSHALLCIIFRHRIEEIKLFSPDRDGRLGYVRHSFLKKSIYQRIGNFFIGIAPLFGGSAVLFGLLLFVHPDPSAFFRTELTPTFVSAQFTPTLKSVVDAGLTLTVGLFDPAHYNQWRFWIFVYLALCVGSHLAPSRADLSGGTKGGLLVLLCMLVMNFVLLILGIEVNRLLADFSWYLTPVLALLFLAIVLNVVWLVVLSILNAVTGN